MLSSIAFLMTLDRRFVKVIYGCYCEIQRAGVNFDAEPKTGAKSDVEKFAGSGSNDS
jgi:hypothetical protein